MLHPHALQRIRERGAEIDEVIETVLKGEVFAAKFNRTGFRQNLQFDNIRHGKYYAMKQIEVYAVRENNQWLVITVIVKFFN